MPDAADIATWTHGALWWAHRHQLCCTPESGSCNLRSVDMERVRRTMPAEWAAFQLASHARADMLNAQAELWPVTRTLDWERLSDAQVQALPFPVQALWALIIMGPANDQENRIELPRGQTATSRFGAVTWAAAERIIRRNHREIAATAHDEIGRMLRILNGPDAIQQAPADIRYFACSPKLHVFAVGGTPNPSQRCWCGQKVWKEWVKAG